MIANPVFMGKAAAMLVAFSEGMCLSRNHILFAPALTTEVAYYTLRNPVVGLITESSSFATHGANILRYSFTLRRRIPWVTSVPGSTLKGAYGKTVAIDYNTITFPDEDDLRIDGAVFPGRTAGGAVYIPSPKRAIVAYDLSNCHHTICYWPHRTYDRLTFSVMKTGLEQSFHSFHLNCTSIELDESGRIWFSDAPYVSELAEMAGNLALASSFLEKQLFVYRQILDCLPSAQSVRDIYSLLIAYFSVFLLFHDTYEDVLIQAKAFFNEHFSDEETTRAMDLLMWCEVDKWMAESDVVLIKRKRLLSDDPLVPIPDLTLDEDLAASMLKFTDYGRMSERLADSDERALRFYIRFFVAKEWKFVLNKLLFTRFSKFCRRLPLCFSELEGKTIADVLVLEAYMDGTH